ncbi:SET domain containing protein [Cryptosporidium ryanae]|uniref:SET domain containing protein n=1 Tax=Cryptosporidium ryanae TaxID=515981 RepID=UPI003519F21E|nr:SET domain containing protein [Cryptosporidium ryanae]
MDFIVKLPIELDADESLVANRRRILEEWNLPSSCVKLWESSDLEELVGDNKEQIIKDLKNVFSNLIKLSHSLYVSIMTEKDSYLAMAYSRREYEILNQGSEGFCDMTKKTNHLENLINICSSYMTKIPFYNPILMIKTLLQLKEIFKAEMREYNKPAKSLGKIENNFLLLLKHCLNVVMDALGNIYNSGCDYDDFENNLSNRYFKIDPFYFDDIIKDFTSPDGTPQISLTKLGVGIHPEHGRGFFSTEKIEPDTNIIEISALCSLSFYTALFSDDFGYVARYLTNPTHYLNEMRSFNTCFDNNSKDNSNIFSMNEDRKQTMFLPIDPDSILMLFIIFQIYKGDNSKWHKVISTWQDPTHAINQNLYMAPKEVTNFLSYGGNNFSSRVSNNVDELYDFLEHVQYLLAFIQQEAIKLSKNLSENDGNMYKSIKFFKDFNYKDIFTWKSLNRAKYVLDTRSFSIKFWPLSKEHYEYSILENLDHNSSLIKQSLDEEENFQVISVPVSDFSSDNSERIVNLLLPVPTESVRTILPVADMFNHSHLAPCSTPKMDYERNMLVVRNEVEIEKNREVFIRYGILTSDECLYGYGFVPVTKPTQGLFDTLTLNFEPDEDDSLYKIKMLVLKHSNIPTDHIFSKLSPKKLTNVDLLIKCIEIVTSDDPISTVKDWEERIVHLKRSKKDYNRENYMRVVSEILESLLNPCIENYNKLMSYKLSENDNPSSKPYWFDDWGDRAIKYYSNQIDLIKLSLNVFKKSRK